MQVETNSNSRSHTKTSSNKFKFKKSNKFKLKQSQIQEAKQIEMVNEVFNQESSLKCFFSVRMVMSQPRSGCGAVVGGQCL